MRLTEEEFAKKLYQIAHNTAAQTLNFSFDQLEHQEILRLIEALKTNTLAHTLDLSAIMLPVESYIALGEYFAQHHTIERLKLSNTEAEDYKISYVLNGLKANQSLQVLNISANKLTNASIPQIQTLVDCSSSLQLIDVSYNGFDRLGLNKIKSTCNPICFIKFKQKSSLSTYDLEQYSSACDKFMFKYVDPSQGVNIIRKRTKFNVKFKAFVDKLFGDIYDKYVIGAEQEGPGVNIEHVRDSINKSVHTRLLAILECHSELINLLDINSIINQVVRKRSHEHIPYDINDFVAYCINDDFLFARLLQDTLVARPGTTRDNMLQEFCDMLLACTNESKEDQKAFLILAYLCSTSFSKSSPERESLVYQIHRCLIDKRELKPISDATASEKWHCAKYLPQLLFASLDCTKIYESIPNLMSTLQDYTIQLEKHDEIKQHLQLRHKPKLTG